MATCRPMTLPAEHESEADLEVRVAAVERLTFFVDAVIAIALTLLALDLPLPSGHTDGAVLRSALDHDDQYLAFVISFMVIGGHWHSHHRVFQYVTAHGGRLWGLTMAWLFMQVVTPFATRVITGDEAFQVRFGFYSLVETAAFVLFILIVLEIRRNGLYRANTPPDLFNRNILHTGILAVLFLVSIPVSLFTHLSWICWVVAPVLTRLGKRLYRHRP
jgi:uncharacterized membrane protein